ncbi:MAG TPA: hypothetical protein VL327_15020 [Pyrinomonadaceae bacterium]|jgi:Ni/Co efflux regulator RcnB|nr:hypothetical protein [Pyrinomonadaceae bacterium]
MKTKLVSIVIFAILIAGSLAVSAAPAALGATAIANRPQLGQILFPRNRRHRHNRRWNNNGNVRYETITERKGHKVYRDTYRITYKNGHEKRKRVERVRVA